MGNLSENDPNQGDSSSFFILPEFSHFKHVFLKLDPSLFLNVKTYHDLSSLSQYLLNQYQHMLGLLDNLAGSNPYNFVITKDWLFMVSRLKSSFPGLDCCNSLAYIGLMYARSEE